jgi:hypothetical protein
MIVAAKRDQPQNTSAVLTIVPSAPTTVGGWTELIQSHMAKTVESIIDTGTALIDCKAALAFGHFREAVEGAGISPRVAQMFMAIANHPVLANTSAYSHLPPAYNTLYQLSRLEPAELAQALEDEAITPKMKANDAAQMANMAKHARDRAELVGVYAPVNAADEFADLLEHDAAVADLLERGVAESRDEAEQIVQTPAGEAPAGDVAVDDEGNPFVEWTFADFVEPPRGERQPHPDEMSPREKIRYDVHTIALELNLLATGLVGAWSTRWPSEIPAAERKEMADYLRADLRVAAGRVVEMLALLGHGDS